MKHMNLTRNFIDPSNFLLTSQEIDTTNMTNQELKKMKKEKQKKERRRNKLLKEAAKVVVDYRPVMSQIIDDYLFRCPSLHFADLVESDQVYVYRFSQPTHIPGYKECWGKSCHTAELPYVFESMDVIRSNYSTLRSVCLSVLLKTKIFMD